MAIISVRQCISVYFIRQGAVGIDGIGPVGDHTSGSGYYSLVARSPDLEDQDELMSTLQSPDLAGANIKCTVFWYFVWGDTCKLAVSKYFIIRRNVNSNMYQYFILFKCAFGIDR